MKTLHRNSGARATGPIETAEKPPKKIIGRFVESRNGEAPTEETSTVAVFCHDRPWFHRRARGPRRAAAGPRGRTVHLFSAIPSISPSRCPLHAWAAATRRRAARRRNTRSGGQCLHAGDRRRDVAVIAYEWTAAGVLSLLRGLRNCKGAVAAQPGTTAQRPDERGARQIAASNATASRRPEPSVHDRPRSTGPAWLPNCADKLCRRGRCSLSSSSRRSWTPRDQGALPVGPLDPMLLFVGDLDERYGPDVALRAMRPSCGTSQARL